MSKGFGSGSSKKKLNVKQFYLANKFVEGEGYYRNKNYSKAELIFLDLKELGYEDPNLFLYLSILVLFILKEMNMKFQYLTICKG